MSRSPPATPPGLTNISYIISFAQPESLSHERADRNGGS
jgi:hypothetical protein